MDNDIIDLYDLEIEPAEPLSIPIPKTALTPNSTLNLAVTPLDNALAVLPETMDDFEQLNPSELRELSKSFLKAAHSKPNTESLVKIPPKSETEKSSKKLSGDEKVELTATAIIDQGELLTTISSLGEVSTYMPYKAKIGEKEIVSYWHGGSPFELEVHCLKCMQKSNIMKMAKCRISGTSANIKSICATAIHHSALRGDKMSPSDRHTLLISSHATDNRGNDLEPMYYDMEKGEILSYTQLSPEKQGRCFKRFCNSVDGVAHVPYIPEEELDIGLVQARFKLARREMEKAYKDMKFGNELNYGIRFEDSVMKWACEDPALYLDILTLAATPLMVRKPECTFFILGEKGNGKSSFRHLLQCAYGTRNVAGLQVAQLGSWDYASTLIGKSLNFPDEESTNIESMDKAVFKSMSTHETISIRQKGSSVPFEILCDFPSIVPLNELPNWKNLDGGVARRITILPFNANLMEETKKGGIGYEERTYTPEFISCFLGEIMGIASFYTQTGNPIIWSPATRAASNAWQKELNSIDLFLEDFQRVFKGFSSVKLLYSCYQNWCKGGLGRVETGIDYAYDSLKHMKEVITIFRGWNLESTVRLPDRKVPLHITCHSELGRPPVEKVLWEGALVDVGMAGGGAQWAGGRDNVLTVTQCLERGWDPVTLRLMSQGLKRRDMEGADNAEASLEDLNSINLQQQIEHNQVKLKGKKL